MKKTEFRGMGEGAIEALVGKEGLAKLKTKLNERKGMFSHGDVNYDEEGFPIVDENGLPIRFDTPKVQIWVSRDGGELIAGVIGAEDATELVHSGKFVQVNGQAIRRKE